MGLTIAREAFKNPAEVSVRFWGKFRERYEQQKPRCAYKIEPDWSRKLNAAIGASDPINLAWELEPIWRDITTRLKGIGIDLGPASYGGHNDGDPEFIRAIWHLITGLQATKVVETGVAHGVTSRFVLEALQHNGKNGHLWSIDLPPMTLQSIHNRIGIAVDAGAWVKDWTYIRGSSRRRLAPLLRKTGSIDLFIHDSLHTEYNMTFEMRTIWSKLRPGGAMVIDDIDLNWGFWDFVETIPQHVAMVCEHQPLRPDPLRLSRNQKGLFGIIIKNQ